MSEGAFSESDISDLPNKEFKITVMKLVTELRRRKDKQELSRKRQKIRKYQVEVTGMKNTINEKYSRGVPQQTKTKKSVSSKTGSRTHPQSRKKENKKD